MALTYKNPSYCNTTSDLTNAYFDIERFKSYYILDSTKWVSHSGSIYKSKQSGYIEALFENGIEQTGVATLVALNAANKFFYDSTADILYFWATGNVNPNTLTIEKGVTWTTFKTARKNDAQEELESYLGNIFHIPLKKIGDPKESYNEESYDFIIRRMTALLTCANIIERLDPNDQTADALRKKVYNPDPDIGEIPGYIQQIKSGDIVLKGLQTANIEPGGYNVMEIAGNTGSGIIHLSGIYEGSAKEIWKIMIDGAGAPGTATFKISYDEGTTYSSTLKTTRNEGIARRRISIGAGIYIEFAEGTFAENDSWIIDLLPKSDIPTISTIGSLRITR